MRNGAQRVQQALSTSVFLVTVMMTLAPVVLFVAVWVEDSDAQLVADRMMPTNDVGQHYTLNSADTVPPLLGLILLCAVLAVLLIAAGGLRRR